MFFIQPTYQEIESDVLVRDKEDKCSPIYISKDGMSLAGETGKQALLGRSMIFCVDPSIFVHSFNMPYIFDTYECRDSVFDTYGLKNEGKKLVKQYVYNQLHEDGCVHVCIHDAQEIIRQMLEDKFGYPVKIDFMTIKPGDMNDCERNNEGSPSV